MGITQPTLRSRGIHSYIESSKSKKVLINTKDGPYTVGKVGIYRNLIDGETKE